MSIKKRMSLFFALLCLAVMFFSCPGHTSDDTKGTKRDKEKPLKKTLPAPEFPLSSVKSFIKANTIVIKWDEVTNATEYVLYRHDTPDGEFNNIVYQGNSDTFDDTAVPINGEFYYYRLAYKINTEISEKSIYSYGIAGDNIIDNNEPNETQNKATILTNKTNYCNIYYYQEGSSNIIQDFDWYYIELEANTGTTITIDGFNNINNGDIMFNLEGDAPQEINSGDSFTITNNSGITKNIYFQISVNTAKFGQKFGKYNITIE